MTKPDQVSKQYELTLNKDKRQDHTNTKEIAGFEVEQNFSYLRSITTNNESCESEIRYRLGMTRAL